MPSINMLDGSGTGVPPPEDEAPPPVDPPLPEDPQPELPQPELPQPEPPQVLTVPRLLDCQLASAGALAATAAAAIPARIAHFISFTRYLHFW